jgi:predicted ATP-binding protein involved in virulence
MSSQKKIEKKIVNKETYITKVVIENFKCFKGRFELDFDKHLNIIVGDNEAGKSTIIEAIHLALSGLLKGRYLKTELSVMFRLTPVDKPASVCI